MKHQLFSHRLQYQEILMISHNHEPSQLDLCRSSLHKNASSDLQVGYKLFLLQLDLDHQHSNPCKNQNSDQFKHSNGRQAWCGKDTVIQTSINRTHTPTTETLTTQEKGVKITCKSKDFKCKHFWARDINPKLEMFEHHIKLNFSSFENPSASAFNPESDKQYDSDWNWPSSDPVFSVK